MTWLTPGEKPIARISGGSTGWGSPSWFRAMSSGGQKRRFGVAGVINILLTNLLLQLLLASNALTIGTSTLISQLFNGILGYSLYGKFVFAAIRMTRLQTILRYATMMTIIWFANSLGITLAERVAIGKNLGALAMIPVLAAGSYAMQKIWVFEKR